MDSCLIMTLFDDWRIAQKPSFSRLLVMDENAVIPPRATPSMTFPNLLEKGEDISGRRYDKPGLLLTVVTINSK